MYAKHTEVLDMVSNERLIRKIRVAQQAETWGSMTECSFYERLQIPYPGGSWEDKMKAMDPTEAQRVWDEFDMDKHCSVALSDANKFIARGQRILKLAGEVA